MSPYVPNRDLARAALRSAAAAAARRGDGLSQPAGDASVAANGQPANGHRPTLISGNDVELREHLRVFHPDFPGPGTVLRLVFEEPGAVVRWDVDIPEPARTIIAKPQHLTAIGLGRDINAHLKATLTALGLEDDSRAESAQHGGPVRRRRRGRGRWRRTTALPHRK